MEQSNQEKWDLRFLGLAKYISTFSKDPSTQTGAVLVSSNKSDIIVGWNGFPQSMSDNPEFYSNREIKYSKIVHCETNAVILARRSVIGYSLYTYPFLSCDRCAVNMIQAGIKRAVAPKATEDALSRWGKVLELSKSYFKEVNIETVEYDYV